MTKEGVNQSLLIVTRLICITAAVLCIYVVLEIRHQVQPITANLETTTRNLANSTANIQSTAAAVNKIVLEEAKFYNDTEAVKARRDAFVALKEVPLIVKQGLEATANLKKLLATADFLTDTLRVQTVPLVNDTLTATRQTVVRSQLTLDSLNAAVKHLDGETLATLAEFQTMLRSANLAPLLADFQRTNERVINTLATMESTINKAGYTAQELQMAIPLVASDVQALLTSLSSNSGNIDALINEIITSARTLNAPQSRKLRLVKFLLMVVIRGALGSLVNP
jgi:hypothetical protein